MRVFITSVNSRYTQSSLSCLYLQAVCQKDFPEINAVRKEYFISQSVEEIASDILENSPDIVCFSVYIWNRDISFQICAYLKISRPDIIIAAGGPEVSYECSQIFKSVPWINAVISGEGEETFSEFLKALSENRSFDKIPGLCTPDSPLSERDPIKDLSTVPSPFLLNLPEKDRRFLHYESSRGCPFCCSYCLSSLTRQVRFFPLDRVYADLSWFFSSSHQMLRFVDRTFNIDQKRSLLIWDFILKNRCLGQKFQFEIDASLLSAELLDFLRQVPENTFQFEIGIQSITPLVLTSCNRNCRVSEIFDAVQFLKKNTAVEMHLDLICGLPGETEATYKEAINTVGSFLPHSIQLGRLKVLKGSPLHSELESSDKISFFPFPPYQVIKTSEMPASVILEFEQQSRLTEIIYNSGKFGNFIRRVIEDSISFSEFLKKLNSFWKNSGLTYHSIVQNKIFSLLWDFCNFFDNPLLYRECLLYDFLISADFKASLTIFAGLNQEFRLDFSFSDNGQQKICRQNSRMRCVFFSFPPDRNPQGLRIFLYRENLEVLQISGEKSDFSPENILNSIPDDIMKKLISEKFVSVRSL